MIQGKELSTMGDKELALYELETRFAMATRQRELLENYIKERLKPEKHFYTIDDEPGRKPSLTKEGAELICLPHALKGRYHWQAGPESPPLDDAPYQITIKCELESNGKFAGEGIGSASSMITKKTGERIQRQKDPGLRHNSTIKMACKSAYIAATLNSTAASEFFTQDLEDDQTGSNDQQNKSADKSQHWCKEHNTVYFKKGGMKGYAHPIGDTGKWCNEKIEEKPQVKVESSPPEQVSTSSEEVPPTGPATETIPVIDEKPIKNEDIITLSQEKEIKELAVKNNVSLTAVGKYMFSAAVNWNVRELKDLKVWQYEQLKKAIPTLKKPA